MTATLPELMFSALFLICMNAGTLLALLPQEKNLQIARAIIARFDRFVAWSFPPREDGQTTSQPGLMISVRRQPVVRIATVLNAFGAGLGAAHVTSHTGAARSWRSNGRGRTTTVAQDRSRECWKDAV